MKPSPLSFCPVPEEQQPLNEYQQLQSSWFFSWATLATGPYWRKLTWVWTWGWLVAGPISAASFSPAKAPFLFFASSSVGAGLLSLLSLARLYLGWSYVASRLRDETVFYEESGWYDGQTWAKPPAVLLRDRLVATHQIDPLLQRLRRSALILGTIVASGSLVWFWR
ncbi:MAG: CGLD27 family protein [Chloroflexaceae bacterium]|nr:CGLD27 family protein [Chloroflexaceae bacterium]